MNVLVLFTPLEPYTFGTDQTFTYSGTEKTGKESYLATSRVLPEQTTLLGVLRFLSLGKKGILKTDYSYKENELAEICSAVGPESFSFQKTEQSFGCIHAISPLFLFREEKRSVLVPNPFHNTAGDNGYCPMKLGSPVHCSEGCVALPLSEQYNAKKGHAGGFLELDSMDIHKDLFSFSTVTGNRKSFGRDRDKGFYRRETVSLKDGYSFAVLADIDKGSLPDTSVAYMGLKRSAFRVTAHPAEDIFGDSASGDTPAEFLKNLVESRLDEGDVWYYALSDLRLSEEWKPASFSIIEEKNIRNIETVYTESTEARRRKRSCSQYNLAVAGSVFSYSKPELLENKNLQTIGYNILCKLGRKS